MHTRHQHNKKYIDNNCCLVAWLAAYLQVHEYIKKNPAIPEVIREAITRTIVGDYRPHWVRDKKFDDSKCPTHESVIIGMEDYNNQSKNLHIR
jgi:hypothetical protein